MDEAVNNRKMNIYVEDALKMRNFKMVEKWLIDKAISLKFQEPFKSLKWVVSEKW